MLFLETVALIMWYMTFGVACLYLMLCFGDHLDNRIGSRSQAYLSMVATSAFVMVMAIITSTGDSMLVSFIMLLPTVWGFLVMDMACVLPGLSPKSERAATLMSVPWRRITIRLLPGIVAATAFVGFTHGLERVLVPPVVAAIAIAFGSTTVRGRREMVER